MISPLQFLPTYIALVIESFHFEVTSSLPNSEEHDEFEISLDVQSVGNVQYAIPFL